MSDNELNQPSGCGRNVMKVTISCEIPTDKEAGSDPQVSEYLRENPDFLKGYIKQVSAFIIPHNNETNHE